MLGNFSFTTITYIGMCKGQTFGSIINPLIYSVMSAKECTMCAGTGRSDLDSTGLSIEEIKNSKYACEFCNGEGEVEYDNDLSNE